LTVRYTRAVLLIFCLAAPTPALAQNSIFGVHGIGFPGRPMSARARAVGGGAATFDARSALNPASVAALSRLTVTASSGTTLRRFNAIDTIADGISETRFPYAMVGSRFRGTGLSVALSYSNYAERSYDQLTSDSIDIRGEQIGVVDQITSSGAVADIRGALAWQATRQLSIGAAVHMMSGSIRLGTRRFFTPSDNYQQVSVINRFSLAGMGYSAGALFNLSSSIALGASVRTDTELKSTLDSAVVETIDLPTSYSGGLFLVPHPSIRWATTFEWQSWSDASADLEAAGRSAAFDSWSLGSGFELGGGSGAPLRIGARYAMLPFSPNDEQASELVFTAGSALAFAGGRATIEGTIERLMRDGAGAEERGWYLMFALTVMP